MLQTADDIFDYMEEVSEEVYEMGYSSYHTDEERAEMYRATYDVFTAKEEDDPKLSEETDGYEILRAINMLSNENFHAEVAALIAHMYNAYGRIEVDIDAERKAFPYLYED